LHERIGEAERRVRRVRDDIKQATAQLVGEEEAARALSAFDPVWGSLTPREQGRVIDLLVERVEYDGAAGAVAVTFRPSGIRALADELAREQAEQRQEKRA
jgi:site-specific DNA recombinase